MIQWPICVSQWLDNKLQDWQRKWFLPETWRALHHFEWTTWSCSKWQRGQITDSTRLPTAVPPSVKCKKWTFDGGRDGETELHRNVKADCEVTYEGLKIHHSVALWFPVLIYILITVRFLCSLFIFVNNVQPSLSDLFYQCKSVFIPFFLCVRVSLPPRFVPVFWLFVCETLLVFVLYNTCLCSSAC